MRDLDTMDTRMRCQAVAAALVAMLLPVAAGSVDYRAIAEQNLFDPQRKRWPEPGQQTAAAPVIGPEDGQVHGEGNFGKVKRAIVRLGGRLRKLVTGSQAGR